MKIGIIGLGSMGFRIAQNILNNDYDLTGYDLNPKAVEDLSVIGMHPADSIQTLAAGVDVLLLMVVNEEQVLDVLFSDNGAFPFLKKDAIVVLSSTVSPSFATNLGKRLLENDIYLIDCPVSGGVSGAEAGTLSLMVSGNNQKIKAITPFLNSFSEYIFNMGEEPGKGSMMKAINQLLCGVHLSVACEAMSMGAYAGLDPETLYEVICNSGGASFVFETHMKNVIEDNYAPKSAVDVFVKDLGIVLDISREMKFPMHTAAAAHQLLLTTSGIGYGKYDDSAIVKTFEKLYDFEIMGNKKE